MLWDLRTGEELRTFEGDIKGPTIRCLAFLPNGKELLVATEKGTAVWDMKQGSQIRTVGKFFLAQLQFRVMESWC